MTRIFVFSLVSLLVGAASRTADAGYSFVTIDDPTGGVTSTTINGINNNGDVVGFGTIGATDTNFVRTANGTFTVLGAVNSFSGMANGINSSGDVVGVANSPFSTPFGVGVPSAFQSSMPTSFLSILASPGSGATSSVAFGVNDGGSIVGQYTTATSTPGFVDVNNGTFTTLNVGTTSTSAQGINNNGIVTGFYNVGTGSSDGFLYNTTTMALTTGLAPSIPNVAFTQFLGINDNNIAVGYYQSSTDGSQHGFLYNANTQQYTFLDDPLASSITQITGINDAGEITGFYNDANGNRHGFIATVVPEPTSLVLAGLGLAGVLVHPRSRRKLTSR